MKTNELHDCNAVFPSDLVSFKTTKVQHFLHFEIFLVISVHKMQKKKSDSGVRNITLSRTKKI